MSYVAREVQHYNEKQLLLERIYRLEAELAHVKLERDAAIMDMKVVPVCSICKHWAKKEAQRKQTLEIPDVCIKCITSRKRQFEWRGLCAENGGAEDA